MNTENIDGREKMLLHLRSIPAMMKDLQGPLRQAAAAVFGFEEARRVNRVIITGCGNSLCVAMAARQAFLALTDVEAQVCDSMELARYMPAGRLAEEGVVTVILSNSGHASRVTELAMRIQKAGGRCVAVCGNPDASLWALASHHLPVAVPPFDFRPDVRSFAPPLMALVYLAAELGRAQGRRPAAYFDEVCGAMEALPQAMAAAMPAMEAQAMAAAASLKTCHSLEAVGSGWDAATAWFAHAKTIAACGLPAVSMDSEDWFHLYYFNRRPQGIGTVLVSNGASPSRSRDLELLETARGLGRPVVAITDGADAFPGCLCIQAPSAAHGFLNPLSQHLAAALLPVLLAGEIGETYHRDAAPPYTACHNYGTLNGSRIVEFD